MSFFPQLRDGALAQYPFSRRTVHRTARNEHADGRMVKLSDPDWEHVVWDLAFTELGDEEKNALERLFVEVEGRLGSFSFLDPWANLLEFSEDLGNTVWQTDAEVERHPYAADPFGGSLGTGLLNRGSQRKGVSQAVPVPAWYQYCFSVYARAAEETDVVLFRSAASERIESAYSVGPNWRRLQHSAALQTQVSPVHFGIEVQAGHAVTVFGFQLEGQLRASPYRKTTNDAGIYAQATFENDALEEIALAPGRHALAVRVRAPGRARP